MQVAWMTDLTRQHADIAELVTVGSTYEKAAIYGLKITSRSALATNKQRPQIYMDGCVHAREWIASAVVQFMVDELITGYLNDPAITALVDSIEWYLVPVFNVDGYKYR